MRLWIVEDGKLVEYERLGKCKQCGQCCCSNTIMFQIGSYTEGTLDKSTEADEGDWSDYEGFTVLRSQRLLWYMSATVKKGKGPCEDFEDGRCTIWMQDDFPAICRYWPVHPNNLEHFPDCGFSFKEVGREV